MTTDKSCVFIDTTNFGRFTKADFKQQFINEELPNLHNNVVGQDCCDAYLEAFDDEGWVISNKDKR